MKPKFKKAETVLLKGKEVVIKVAGKNFSTKGIYYKLEDGRKVNEGDLEPLTGKTRQLNPKKDPKKPEPKKPTTKEPTELELLQGRYTELYGKKPGNKNKNNAEWLTGKIEEKEAELKEASEDTDKWEAINALDQESIVKFIEAKELDIDPEDYADLAQIKEAVADELEIEIPE